MQILGLMLIIPGIVFKYTLPEDNEQILASKYKLYLPSKDELKEELSESYE